MRQSYLSVHLLLLGAAITVAYELSKERERCAVQEALDSFVFPPERYPDSAIRIALSGVPVVRDLHLHIRVIDIENINLKVAISRKSDTKFNFKVTGRDGEEKAHFKAYLRDVDFATPNEKWATNTAKGISGFEQGWTSFAHTVTFGLADKKGNLTQIPATFNFIMSGDFELDKDGEWSLVKGSEKQDMDFDFGNGGALMGIVKMIVEGAGTIDEQFMNIFWPIAKMFIPPNIGKAFQAVPYRNGEISTYVEVTGKCKHKVHGRHGCASDDLDLDVVFGFTLSAHIEPVVRAIAKNKELKDEFYYFFVQNLKDQLDKGAVIKGNANFGVEKFELLDTHAVTASASPILDLPMAILSALVGKDISLNDFLPETDAMALTIGKFWLSAGKLILNGVSFGGLRLPINDEALSVDSVVLEEATIEVEDVPEDIEEAKALGIFDPKCPVSLAIQGVNVELTRSNGLTMTTGASNASMSALSANVDKKLINDQLDAAGKKLRVPTNVRTEQPLTATGKMPKYFEAPLPQKKPFLDLQKEIKHVDGSVTLTIAEGSDQKTDLTFRLPFSATIGLSPAFVRGAISSQIPDFGYAYMAVPVQYKNSRAFALLSCGTLRIFTDLSEDSKPFATEPTLEIDLAAVAEASTFDVDSSTFHGIRSRLLPAIPASAYKLEFGCCCREGECLALSKKRVDDHHIILDKSASCASLIGSDWRQREASNCGHLKCATFKFGKDEGTPLCAKAVDLESLVDAVVLQVARFAKSLNNHKYSDGTWFKTFNPYDVTTLFPTRDISETQVYSPRQAWIDARKPLHTKTTLSELLARKQLIRKNTDEDWFVGLTESQEQEKPMKFYYWRLYGLNNPNLFQVTESEYNAKKNDFPVGTRSKADKFKGYYWHGSGDDEWIAHPGKYFPLTYSADTYWYGYFKSNKISPSGTFSGSPLDL